MNEVFQSCAPRDRGRWQLISYWRLVARITNCARAKQLFVAKLLVAPGAKESFFVSNGARVLLGDCLETKFLLDTGCERTLISADLAFRLKLQRKGETDLVSFQGLRLHGYRSSLSILLGSNWLELPCAFPDILASQQPTENLLSAKALLKDHLLCLSHKELWMFRKPRDHRLTRRALR